MYVILFLLKFSETNLTVLLYESQNEDLVPPLQENGI